MEPLKSFFRRNEGQSLVEILVGLAIGALLIGTATIGIVFVLKSSTTNQNLGAGTDLAKGLLDNVQNFAASNWSSLYGLSHGASSTYFIVASGTNLFAAPGAEGVLGNDVPNGLVGHWGLDEGTGTVTYDESGNGGLGSWTGTQAVPNPNGTNYSTGKVGTYAGYFSSNTSGVGNYVQVPQSTVLNLPSLSFSAWLYQTAYGSGNPGATGFVLDPNVIRTFSLSGGVSIQAWNGSAWVSFNAGQTVPLNTWTLYTFTFSSGTVSQYINGNLAAQGSLGASNLSNPTGALYLGTSQGNYYGFNGLIDDVRIYSRALSASEVKQLYDSQGFSRYFYVQDVCRTNDASSSISGNPPCSGYDDPLTQQVTAVTQWLAGAATDNVSFSTYLTNYQNFTLRQSDWSGGGGQTGPLTIPNTQYASGTNVTGTSTLGSFRIQNLTQQ